MKVLPGFSCACSPVKLENGRAGAAANHQYAFGRCPNEAPWNIKTCPDSEEISGYRSSGSEFR